MPEASALEHADAHRGRRAHDAARSSSSTRCKEHRDGHINSGMEGGMQEAMDLLEQVAISLR